MEQIRRPSAEELLRRIQELEANIKHQHQINMYYSSCNNLTEKQYLNILHSVGRGINIFDRQYRINFWNRTAEEIYALTAAQAVGKTPTELLVDRKDAVTVDYLLERTVNGETWSGEFPITNKKGETFVLLCTNTPFRDQTGKLIGGIGMFADSRLYPASNLQVDKSLVCPDDIDSIEAKLCHRFNQQQMVLSMNYEIIWEDLTTKRQIGQGSCGTVHHGLWQGCVCSPSPSPSPLVNSCRKQLTKRS